jgi:hypothetical protein
MLFFNPHQEIKEIQSPIYYQCLHIFSFFLCTIHLSPDASYSSLPLGEMVVDQRGVEKLTNPLSPQGGSLPEGERSGPSNLSS